MIALAVHHLGDDAILSGADAHPRGSVPEPRDCRGERLAIGDPVMVQAGVPPRGVVTGFEWGRRNGHRLVVIVVVLVGGRSVRATSVEVRRQDSAGGDA